MSQPFEEFLASLEEIGGESLIGSGFENEIPEEILANLAESSVPSRQRATWEGDHQ
jgi:hypothetical protein